MFTRLMVLNTIERLGYVRDDDDEEGYVEVVRTRRAILDDHDEEGRVRVKLRWLG